MGQERRPAVARRFVRESVALLLNCTLFLVAFFVGLRIVYPLLFSILGMWVVGPGSHHLPTGQQAIALSISLTFVVAGGLAALYTSRFAAVITTSVTMYLLGMILLAQAMYLVDRGDPALTWHYVQPHAPQYIGAVISSGAAAAGWYVATTLRRRRRVCRPRKEG